MFIANNTSLSDPGLEGCIIFHGCGEVTEEESVVNRLLERMDVMDTALLVCLIGGPSK